MIPSELLNAIGLTLDAVGFAVLFYVAFPVFMRRDFVATDRLDIEGVRPDKDQFARLADPQGAERLRQRRNRRQTAAYVTGGTAVVVGFLLQIAASFIP